MAGSLNKATLIGRLGKDPEIKGSGENTFAVFSIATDESWKDKRTGEKKTETEWHDITVFNETARKFAEHYLHKGDMVYVEGQIKKRSYEKDGVKMYATSIVIKPFSGVLTSLSSKGEGGGDRSSDSREERPPKSSAPAFESGSFDDDIPF